MPMTANKHVSRRPTVLIALQLGLPDLPTTPPTPADLVERASIAIDPAGPASITNDCVQADAGEMTSQIAKDLHKILLETCIQEGKLVCGSCEHEYAVKEGVANFLLPGHLV